MQFLAKSLPAVDTKYMSTDEDREEFLKNFKKLTSRQRLLVLDKLRRENSLAVIDHGTGVDFTIEMMDFHEFIRTSVYVRALLVGYL